ncbi:hypothetical protein FV226_25325 [Methylobacterium sp. WL12]|uniref:hypothetical protein n=1 Tax=Methylobacterium sp. WL12 TaxID=2603890 RepID=UPI0011C79815|nr:hypothetical protein [Methylobacterium sp. WL12]TXM65240.1 hypothetical protein FV226_25325 [Methylobacterium sp. WL12]
MRRNYIGLYWTLPVTWKRFYYLPDDLDPAAARSTTIRYQRERVRRWVDTDGAPGELVDHIHYIDVRPDRATDVGIGYLASVVDQLRSKERTLVYVDFADGTPWRPQRALKKYLFENDLDHESIQPDRVPLDGKPDFDIIKHFADWKLRHGEHQERHQRALSELFAAAASVPAGSNRYAAIAEMLHDRREGTTTGKMWTAANVEQQLRRHGLKTSSARSLSVGSAIIA